MRYRILIILCILLIVGMMFVPNTYAYATLTNPSFESGTSGWTIHSDTSFCHFGTSSGNAHSGTYDVWLDRTAGTGAYIYQNLVTNGITNITVWYRCNPAECSATTTKIDIMYQNPDTQAYYCANSELTITKDNAWHSWVVPIPAGAQNKNVKLSFGWQEYSGGADGDKIHFDDIMLNGVPNTRYILNGDVRDEILNKPIAGVTVNIQNSGHTVIGTVTTDSNGCFSYNMDWVDGNYEISTSSDSYQTGVTQFNKPSDFVQSGSDYYCTLNVTRYPVVRQGYLYTIDSVTRGFVYPSSFYIEDYELGSMIKVDSPVGILNYNFTYHHHYNVTGNKSGYFNTTVVVIPNTNNFIGYIEMVYSGNYAYDITGQVFDNALSPVPLANAIVCLYWPNGTVMKTTVTDGAGNYHIRTFSDIDSDNYNVEANFSTYDNSTISIGVPADFIQKGTYDNNVYYLNGCNIYLNPHVTGNNGYLKFLIFNVYQQVLGYANVVLSSTTDTEKVYTFSADNNGKLTTPMLPYDTYVYQVYASGYGKGTGQITLNAENNGYQIIVKLYPEGYSLPTPTPVPWPSGVPTPVPTDILTPTAVPVTITPVPNPFVPANTTGAWGTFIHGWFNIFGIDDSYLEGIILGLIMTLVCGFAGASFGSYVSNGSGTLTVYLAVFFGACGFICSCLLNLIPIWILIVFILAICGIIAFLKFGNNG